MGLDQARPGTSPAVHTLEPITEGVAADTLLRQLQERLAADQPVRIDGSAVIRISTPALQVLASAQKTAAERALSFQIYQPSEPLEAACRTLGLSMLLEKRG